MLLFLLSMAHAAGTTLTVTPDEIGIRKKRIPHEPGTGLWEPRLHSAIPGRSETLSIRLEPDTTAGHLSAALYTAQWHEWDAITLVVGGSELPVLHQPASQPSPDGVPILTVTPDAWTLTADGESTTCTGGCDALRGEDWVQLALAPELPASGLPLLWAALTDAGVEDIGFHWEPRSQRALDRPPRLIVEPDTLPPAIQHDLTPRLSALLNCYAEELTVGPRAAGTVAVRIVFGRDGSFAGVRADGFRPRVDRCIEETLSGIHRGGGPAGELQLTLRLSPR